VLAEVTVVAGVGGLVLILADVWVVAPGVLLAACVFRSSSSSHATSWLIGPALGFGFGVSGILLLWAAGLHGGWVLVLGPLIVVAVAVIVRLRGAAAVKLPAFSRRDAVPLMLALLIVPLITAAPYANVRRHLPEGDAYRAYFTADFIWAMSAAAEISKGDVPPVNPFHHGEPMRYYWMSHILSGAEYRAFQPLGLSLEGILLTNGVLFGLAFVAFIYWLARALGASPGWALTAIVAGFAANSYEGADMIRAIVSHHDPWEVLRDTNIDAVTRWFYKGMAVDGLHRLLLYQPHHLTGYVLALSGLTLVTLADDVTHIAVALWVGILLGLGLLFSTFGALIVTAAAAVVYVYRLWQRDAIGLLPQCAILAGGPVLVGVALTRILGYTNPADGLLMTVGVNPVALHRWPWVAFLSFGPLLLMGVPALLRPAWVRGAGAAPAALVLASALFYFFVDVPDMGGVWVGWRSGHMLLIAFVVASACGLTALWAIAERRAAVAAVVAVALLLAAPTVAIDTFNAQDINNRHDGAGFPWTLVISPAEREAFDWIRANTPADAVIQAEPFVRDPATWAYVPAFAERRMAAGLPISMVPHQHYAAASNDVRAGIFNAVSANDAHEWAEYLNIDYVLIGDRERRNYGSQVERMRSRSDLFETVFRNDAILLLKVLRDRHAAVYPQ
jgi:hypothetical protein